MWDLQKIQCMRITFGRVGSIIGCDGGVGIGFMGGFMLIFFFKSFLYHQIMPIMLYPRKRHSEKGDSVIRTVIFNIFDKFRAVLIGFGEEGIMNPIEFRGNIIMTLA